MKALALAVGFVLFGLTLSSGLSAGNAKDEMEAAMRFYQSGDLQRSVAALNDALAAVREEKDAKATQLFPEPLAGWRADPPQLHPDTVATLFSGAGRSRRYFRDDGAEITLSLLANSPFVPFLAMSVPASDQPPSENGPNPFALKGYRGMIEQHPDTKQYLITLFAANRLMIHATGRGLSDDEPIRQYLQALDIDAILKMLGPVGRQ